VAKRIFSTVTLWLVILAFATVSRATVTTSGSYSFTLGRAGKLSLDTPVNGPDWHSTSTSFDNGLKIELTPLHLKNQTTANVKATFDIIVFNETPSAESWDHKAVIMRDQYAEHYGKPKVDLKPYKFSQSQGHGAYCAFIDPNLVGTPTQPGHYKVVAPGLIYLNTPSGVVEVSVVLYADDADGLEMTALRSIVESIRFTPPPNPDHRLPWPNAFSAPSPSG